ncbi:MAG: HEPN domain-containing protein [Egibacteraceae bacterium]
MSGPPDAGRARRWLGEAAEDLEAARRIAADEELPARLACFLAHLAAEKTLKASLIDLDVPFRKTHDLIELFRMEFSEADLKRLNPWAIDGRYNDHLIET